MSLVKEVLRTQVQWDYSRKGGTSNYVVCATICYIFLVARLSRLSELPSLFIETFFSPSLPDLGGIFASYTCSR